MIQPIERNSVKYYFIINGEKVRIDEPISIDDIPIGLEQDKDFYGRFMVIEEGIKIKITPRTRTYGFQFERIMSEFNYNGDTTDVLFRIEIDDLEFLEGRLDFTEYTTDNLTYIEVECKFDIIKEVLKDNESKEVDLFSDKTLNDEAILPLQLDNILLKSKGINSIGKITGKDDSFRYIWTRSNPTPFICANLIRKVTFQTNQNIIENQNTGAGGHPYFGASLQIPKYYEQFGYIEFKDEQETFDVNATINIRKISQSGFNTTNWIFMLRKKIVTYPDTNNFGTPINEQSFTLLEKNCNNSDPFFENISYSENYIVPKNSVIVYYVFAFGSDIEENDYVQIDGAFINISYNEIFDDTTVTGTRLINIGEQVIKSITDNKLLSIVAPQYKEFGGKFFDIYGLSGSLLRKYITNDKGETIPFIAKWKDFVDNFRNAFNNDWQFLIDYNENYDTIRNVKINFTNDEFNLYFERPSVEPYPFEYIGAEIIIVGHSVNSGTYIVEDINEGGFGFGFIKLNLPTTPTQPLETVDIKLKIQKQEYTVYIGEHKDFYQDIECGRIEFITDTDSYEISFNPKLAKSGLVFNFEDFEEDKDSTNTIDSIHKESSWHKVGSRIEEKEEREIPYTADAYKIEYTRRDGIDIDPTKSLSQDNDIYMIDTVVKNIDGVNTLTNRTNEGFTLVNNLFSPSTAINLRLSLKRLLIDNYKYWLSNLGILTRQSDIIWKNIFYKNNSIAETESDLQTTTNDLIIEGDNINDITQPLITHRYFKFTVAKRIKWVDIYYLIRTCINQRGYITFYQNEKEYKMYPSMIKYIWEDEKIEFEGEEKFKSLANENRIKVRLLSPINNGFYNSIQTISIEVLEESLSNIIINNTTVYILNEDNSIRSQWVANSNNVSGGVGSNNLPVFVFTIPFSEQILPPETGVFKIKISNFALSNIQADIMDLPEIITINII